MYPLYQVLKSGECFLNVFGYNCFGMLNGDWSMGGYQTDFDFMKEKQMTELCGLREE